MPVILFMKKERQMEELTGEPTDCKLMDKRADGSTNHTVEGDLGQSPRSVFERNFHAKFSLFIETLIKTMYKTSTIIVMLCYSIVRNS